MENPKGSSSNISEKSLQLQNQPNFAIQNLLPLPPDQENQQQQQQPLNIISEKTSQTSKDSKAEAQREEKEEKFIRDTLKLIDNVALEAEMFRQEIDNFSGTTAADKDYLYLEEMLVRATLTLDAIDTRGNAIVRKERKRAVQYIQKLMHVLDSRLKENKRQLRYYTNPEYSDDYDDV